MNSIEHMKMAAFQELKDALQTKRVNDELLEYLASSLRWILRYCQRYNMPIPEKEKIIELMNRAIEIEDKLPSSITSSSTSSSSPTESQQRNKTPDDSTEPNFIKSRGATRSKRLLGVGLATSNGEYHSGQRLLVIQPTYFIQSY